MLAVADDLKGRDFTKVADWSRDELLRVLDLADELKRARQAGEEHRLLPGRTLGMIFQKPSTRTRVSFEVGMWQLGGVALYLSASDLQLGRGETVKDTALVLSRYLDAIMIRTFEQADVEELARNATIPVINGLTDSSHPCQALADAMTIRERLGRFDGVRLTYLGDGNNVCASLMVAAAKLGMHFTAAVPPGYEPDEGALDTARTAAEETGAAVRVVHDPREASEGADVLYTDVWTSMGQEEERERRLRDLAGFGISDELLALAEDDAIVLHCLPAHYGEEITEEIAYGPQVGDLGRGGEPPARPEGAPRPHRSLIPLKDNVPTRRFPIVTVGLIVANVLVFFLYQAPDLDGSVSQLAYQPCEVNNSCPVTGEDWPITSFTSMFMHGSIIHLAGNMLFLWIFGNNVEDAFGRVRYLIFYLLAGYAATALQTVITLWMAPESAEIPNLGASGAISGVLGAVLRAAAAREGADPDLPRDHLLPAGDPGGVLPRHLLRVPALGCRLPVPAPAGGRRRGRLRAPRRVALRRPDRLPLPRARAAAPTLLTFEEHVTRALDALPADIARRLENVAVVVEDEHPEEPDLLGLFEGGGEYMPDKVTIYRLPLEADFPDPAELEQEIRITVLHELGHYFGLDEGRLEELGYE